MTKHICRSTFLMFAALILTVSVSEAQTPSFGRPERVKYKSQFNEEATGTIAFLPGLGSEKYLSWVNRFDILRNSGFYELPAKGYYYFQVQNVSSDSQVTFLECATYAIFRKGESPKDPISVYRSAGKWEGRKYSDGSVRNVSVKEFKLSVSTTLDAFSQTHQGDNLKAVHELMGHRLWHAWPSDDPDCQGSWDFRKDIADGPPARFDDLIQACGLADRKAADLSLTVHLIRFTTPTEPGGGSPLYFNFNADNALGAYMHVRSPLFPHGTKDFFFKFTDNTGSATR